MIVHLPRRRKHFPFSDPIPGIERAEKLNILGITVSQTLTSHHHVSALVAKYVHVPFMLLRPFALMVSMAVLCGTSLVPLWSHNFSMPALHGGDILKPMKETDYSQSYRRLQDTVFFRAPSLLTT